MSDSFANPFNCVLCQESSRSIYEIEEDSEGYEIHCSSCARWILLTRGDSTRVALREVLGLQGEALALAVQTYLAPCTCGHPFSHDGGRRCLSCLKKIKKETPSKRTPGSQFHCIWDLPKMKEALEGKFFSHILARMDSEEETLTQLVDRYESGEIDPGVYMESLEKIQLRESRDVAVIKSWAMLAGPEMAFQAAEDHALTQRYGSRILVSIASGLEMGYGISILSTLSREEKNLDGVARKEIRTFLRKIAGGF